ncbi:MAG: polysaccharide deacetylase family protein [Agriterribacter sp.]
MKKIFIVLGFVLTIVFSEAQIAPKLIVRADDMGFAHSGNLALIKTWKDGIATSVEVIVPSPWFPEAVKLLAENPAIDVGIHLAITSEWDNVKWRPVSDCPSLKDEDGYFYPMVWPNKNYPNRAILDHSFALEDIEKEFRAQIALALKKIPRISHISGHMGCTNINPEVKQLVEKLSREYKIHIDLAEQKVKSIGFAGPHKTFAEKKKSFLAMLNSLQPGNTYLFVEHPAFDDAEMRAIHHIGYENVAEDRQGITVLFTDEEVKTFIKKKHIQLISYKDLLKQ